MRMHKSQEEKDYIVVDYIISNKSCRQYAKQNEVDKTTLRKWDIDFKKRFKDWESICEQIKKQRTYIVDKASLGKCPCSNKECQNRFCLKQCEDYRQWTRKYNDKYNG